jgi:RNA polymerase sigma factor (sigma-70 family)
MALSIQQLALCKNKDAKGQQDFYDFYKARMMGMCRRYTRNKEEAEDVFQEVFIRVFRSIDQLKDFDCLDQWLMKIAVNTAIKYYHKNKRHEHNDEHDGHSHQNDDHELILSHFSDEMLIRLINELSDAYRIVFNLHEVEGYSHGEIAKLLEISEVTCRSRLNRARQILKLKLQSIGIVKYEKYG